MNSIQQIPFFSLESSHGLIKDELLKAFNDVLNKSSFILGERVKSFEEEYANFNKVKYSIGISNGLDALVICLKCLGIGPGDEVIVPSHTFFASALAVHLAGAKIVFAEPDPGTFLMDPKRIGEAVNSKTKAIMPVHLYGQACAMEEIMKIANARNVHVIEDNAQAQGATNNNFPTGSFGIMNATSFYPTKNLGALGDAGAITTNDAALAKLAMTYRNYGSGSKYVHDTTGQNARLDEMQAAFLSVKLKHLNQWNVERCKIADWYNTELSGLKDVSIPVISPGSTSVYHLYVIQAERRNDLQSHLLSKGIHTLIHYPIPSHLQKAFSDYNFRKGQFPIAEKLAERVLSLPIYPGLTKGQVTYICEAIQSFYNR